MQKKITFTITGYINDSVDVEEIKNAIEDFAPECLVEEFPELDEAVVTYCEVKDFE